jgi:hypothetical protein
MIDEHISCYSMSGKKAKELIAACLEKDAIRSERISFLSNKVHELDDSFRFNVAPLVDELNEILAYSLERLRILSDQAANIANSDVVHLNKSDYLFLDGPRYNEGSK